MKVMSKIAPFACVLTLVSACANSGANYVPVVDGPKGPTFDADLAACQALAAQQPRADGSTAAATATGAGLSALSASVFDDADVGEAAVVGAVGGLVSNAFSKSAERESIVRNCMSGRGHRVVG